MTDEQIKHMAQRFLAWGLPENFNPDGGVTYEPVANAGTPYEHVRHTTGTNLLTYTQAVEMIRHMLEDLPAIAALDAARGETADERQAAIVAWLRGPAWHNMTWRRRIVMAVRCFIDPSQVYRACLRHAANALEARAHWKDDQ